MPALLAAAGLRCDLVSASPSFRLSRHIRRLELVDAARALLPAALACWQQDGPYRWVIGMTDSLLGELAQRVLLDPAYRCLLPLTAGAGTDHLYSKIGLSRAFSAAGIPTPAWGVARDAATALQQVAALGWPVLLKQDASAGGKGVWPCWNPAELAQAAARQSGQPFLLQRWLDGSLYSVEALYQHGLLRAFALSAVEACIRENGPSAQRRYGLPSDQIPELEVHLERIGAALGLHGFTNISLMHTPGALPQFFECDVRPNAWLQLDQALGGDFARALRGTGSRACYTQLPAQSLISLPQRPLPSPACPSALPCPPPDEDPAFLNVVLGVLGSA